MAEEKEYMVIEEAHEIIRLLKGRYPQHLRFVVPEEIVVLGVTNKDRPPTMDKLARIKLIEPEMRAVLGWLNSKWKYYVEVFCSDYQTWGPPRRQWIIFHELVHVPGPADKGLIQHDIEDFAVMVDAGSYDWSCKEHLPNLLEGDPFPFKLGLIDKLHAEDEPED